MWIILKECRKPEAHDAAEQEVTSRNQIRPRRSAQHKGCMRPKESNIILTTYPTPTAQPPVQPNLKRMHSFACLITFKYMLKECLSPFPVTVLS